MPSNMIISAAAAVLSLSGMATALVGTAPYANMNATSAAGAAGATGAYPTAPYGSANATNSASKPSSTGSIYNPDLIFCPGLNNQVFTDARGRHYVIQCSTTHDGIEIDIIISNAKRAVAASLDDCMLTCDEDSACIATSFNKDTQTCKYFSTIGGPIADNNVDFAYVTQLDGTTVTPGQQMTSTVFTTTESTIYSCAPTVTNCPLRNNGANGGSAVVTDTIALYTTICPYSGVAASTIAAAPVACTGCPVSAGTATVYSATVQQGTSTVVPVSTAVVNYVQPTATAVSTGATATVASGVGSAASASSSVEAFTGAAGHVEAGMGMAAVMAMAVFAL